MEKEAAEIPLEQIQQTIILVRGHKVMLDQDLARFYGVTTSNLNKAVARNIKRFPGDFMFQLSTDEQREFLLQSRVPRARGGRRTRPYAFTEQGVAMLSAVLQSQSAIAVSVQIMRGFVKLRELLLSDEAFSKRLRALESKSDEHSRVIVQILKELHKPPNTKTRRIGF